MWVAGLGVEEATAAITDRLRGVLNEPEVYVSLNEPSDAVGWYLPLTQYHLKPLDTIRINVEGTRAGEPIDDIFWLGPDASVNLGPAYGSLQVGGMRVDDAEAAITAHLREVLRSPEVSVELLKASEVPDNCLPLAPTGSRLAIILKFDRARRRPRRLGWMAFTTLAPVAW